MGAGEDRISMAPGVQHTLGQSTGVLIKVPFPSGPRLYLSTDPGRRNVGSYFIGFLSEGASCFRGGVIIINRAGDRMISTTFPGL